MNKKSTCSFYDWDDIKKDPKYKGSPQSSIDDDIQPKDYIVLSHWDSNILIFNPFAITFYISGTVETIAISHEDFFYLRRKLAPFKPYTKPDVIKIELDD